MNSRYRAVYESWKSDPESFWAAAAREIDWFKPWDKVFDGDAGVYGRWFTGAECNTCYNAIDRHVDGGRADQIALIHDSAITGRQKKFTYRELKIEVEALAAVLRDHGIGKGDRVIIYMPMVPEAAFAMLACARIGAVHSVVFGGFAARELDTRIDDSRPRLVISASCGLEPGRIVAYKPLLDQAIEMAVAKPEACIVLRREQLECVCSAGVISTMQKWLLRRRPRAARRNASRSLPPIRSMSSTRPVRPASRKGSFATMAATWSR